MLPSPGQYVCYFPLSADIELDRQNEPFVDDYNRFYTTDLREAVYAPHIVKSLTSSSYIDICGIGYWDDGESFEEISKDSKDKYCRILAPDLSDAMDIYDRELFLHLSVSDIKESRSRSDVVEVYDMSLESIKLEGGPVMQVSMLVGVIEPDTPIVESQSDSQDLSSTDSLLSEIGNWMIENKDNLLAGAISGAALETAQYFLDDTAFSENPPQQQGHQKSSTNSREETR